MGLACPARAACGVRPACGQAAAVHTGGGSRSLRRGAGDLARRRLAPGPARGRLPARLRRRPGLRGGGRRAAPGGRRGGRPGAWRHCRAGICRGRLLLGRLRVHGRPALRFGFVAKFANEDGTGRRLRRDAGIGVRLRRGVRAPAGAPPRVRLPDRVGCVPRGIAQRGRRPQGEPRRLVHAAGGRPHARRHVARALGAMRRPDPGPA
mmetsp:Transcript_35041/g.105860  ORF Transcript_35041/g.105860 Transcript_35041/m.105860 type:complete len:207 (+) Transcript_35041:478-1098(+)